ncbi:response regulator [Candidatus Woesearchaeota archaeon]|nr:response regulator [Candidatus Woesearchaeota archaeon]
MEMNQAIIDEIMQFLKSKEIGASTSDIAKSLNRNRVTITKYLEVMKAKNLISNKVLAQAKFWKNKDNEKQTIMIVDDEENVLKLIKLSLIPGNYDLIEARNGIECLEKVRERIPDLILLDLMMPKMDGMECCRILRSNPITQNIPVIMLTAKTQVNDKLEGFSVGTDDYITKPFDPLELEARVKTLLKRNNNLVKLNAVTGLPGLEPLLEKLKETKARILFIDLVDFKKYNKQFGYKSGNELLQLVSRILLSAVEEAGTPEDYIAHIGADDFIILTYSNLDKLANKILIAVELLPSFNPNRTKLKLNMKEIDSLDVKQDIHSNNFDAIIVKAKKVI